MKSIGGFDYVFGSKGRFLLSTECRKRADIPLRVIDTKTGFYIDIFVFYDEPAFRKLPQEMFSNTSDKRIAEEFPKVDTKTFAEEELYNPYPWQGNCKSWSKSDLFPTLSCEFEGEIYPCPKKIEKILGECYGHNWKTPVVWAFL